MVLTTLSSIHIPSPEELLGAVAIYGYPLIFIGFIMGGPLVTTGVSFAASIGYFNIYAIIVLSLIAEPTGDSIYYWIGRFGRRTFIARLATRDSFAARLNTLESLVRTHMVKTIVISKLTPLAPAPSLMAAGIAKIPYRKFIGTCFMVTLPQTFVYVGIGYFFGSAYARVAQTVENGVLLFAFALIATYGIYHAYQKVVATFFTTADR
jgi:membrane protein DedA with SNARE-associated domain